MRIGQPKRPGRIGLGIGLGLGMGGGAPTAFNPLTYSPALWLKADGTLWQNSARTTPVTSDGDPVGAWDDGSGNSRHPLQTLSGKKGQWTANVQNGKPGVLFDGVDDFLVCASQLFSNVSAMSLFFAFKGTGAVLNGNKRPFGHSAPAGNDLTLYFNGAVTFPAGLRIAATEPAAAGPTDRTATSSAFILSMIATGTSTTVWDNGNTGTPLAQVVSGFSSSAAGFGVGGSAIGGQPTSIYILEAIAYPTDMTANRLGMQSYLNARYAAF